MEFAGSRLVAFSNSLCAGSNRPMAASATASTLCTRGRAALNRTHAASASLRRRAYPELSELDQGSSMRWVLPHSNQSRARIPSAPQKAGLPEGASHRSCSAPDHRKGRVKSHAPASLALPQCFRREEISCPRYGTCERESCFYLLSLRLCATSNACDDSSCLPIFLSAVPRFHQALPS